MNTEWLGIDVGAETVKLAALGREHGAYEVTARLELAHAKDPHGALSSLLDSLDLSRVRTVAATGRLHRIVSAASVPTKAALKRGLRSLRPELKSATILSIGAHGFCVLELPDKGPEWFQQNARCSQGTGSFLIQLVERFGLTIEEASALCEQEEHPAPLSGRCPVILKTDMTHLANKGEDRARILAGLYDAVAENVVTLLRPGLAPPDVVLLGGVARSLRIRRQIARWLEERGLRLCEARPEDDHVEAIGAALHAAEQSNGSRGVSVASLLGTAQSTELERTPALQSALHMVHRMPKSDPQWDADAERPVLLGLDIGSTGTKAVAVDAASGTSLWEAYLNTEGAPVRAAQRLMERWNLEMAERASVLGFGVTGSGREIVGSLLRTCYGSDRVFVLNEIAAHARGATQLDSAVDTIFEIGGQDAKYIRLEGGRVVDAAMNEACSAGTGSFIAEQGARFDGVDKDVTRLAELALEAEEGISLGQHCSVFMAEVIDEAIAQGAPHSSIIAGLYDSVIQNYLNRVKGTRTVGERIFCQGMPFSSNALAAAVARQTGRDVVVPPNPGTIGAFGIALLLLDEKGAELRGQTPVDPSVFLGARVASKEQIICRSTKGCGGTGNLCRIDRLTTEVNGQTQRFLWGGNCSLYDRGMGRGKLPDMAPDVFREREALVDALIDRGSKDAELPVVALSDEFALKNIAPLVIVFLQELGFRCQVLRRADVKLLKQGIERARVPYCAPVQLAHGVYTELARSGAKFLVLPRLRDLPRVAGEEYGVVCPLVVASPDLLESVRPENAPRTLSPVFEFDADGYDGVQFELCLRALCDELGRGDRFAHAARAAIKAQKEFDEHCYELGRRALEFCERERVVPVAVLGRPYTIYNDVLNSNVPSILRSLGAMPIPVDCLPVPKDTPVFDQQYWGHTQRNLRAAHYVRKTNGLYSVFCSNYACGPDSFTLHFYSYIMQNKPFAVVETDGHAGDAGTKTRMEAFLYCVDTDLRTGASTQAARTDLNRIDQAHTTWTSTRQAKAHVFLPRMGPSAEVAAAALRADGIQAECLPLSTREDVRIGRRHTSGKECVPMMLTIGALLKRLEKEPRHGSQKYGFLMPTAHGPCRFGVYHTLHKIALERAGWGDRVSILSPDDSDYFEGMSADFSARLWTGFVAHDLLQAMLFHVRPLEVVPGSANAIHARYFQELLHCAERRSDGSTLNTLRELSGPMWGIRSVIERAAQDFSALPRHDRRIPSVAVVGEIYVRLDPFANDFIVDKLEARGLRVRFAPFIEWLEYSNQICHDRIVAGTPTSTDDPVTIGVTSVVQHVTLQSLYGICAKRLGWGPRVDIPSTLEASRRYIHPVLKGEAALTIGGPLYEYEHELVEGVVIVGPHECMPCKIAEAQYGKASEDTGIPYLSIAVSGDPIDTEMLDRFAYDIHHSVDGARRETLVPRLRVRPDSLVPARNLVRHPSRRPGGPDMA